MCSQYSAFLFTVSYNYFQTFTKHYINSSVSNLVSLYTYYKSDFQISIPKYFHSNPVEKVSGVCLITKSFQRNIIIYIDAILRKPNTSVKTFRNMYNIPLLCYCELEKGRGKITNLIFIPIMFVFISNWTKQCFPVSTSFLNNIYNVLNNVFMWLFFCYVLFLSLKLSQKSFLCPWQ